MGRHALRDQGVEHDEHDELERRHLAEFALAEQADQQEQDEEHRRGAKNDIHQGSTLMRSGIAPMRRSPSNTAISPRVPANSGGLIWPSILTWRRSPASRSEEHTSELQSLMRISYAVFCLQKKKNNTHHTQRTS